MHKGKKKTGGAQSTITQSSKQVRTIKSHLAVCSFQQQGLKPEALVRSICRAWSLHRQQSIKAL
jgi:hypothetical protein